MCRADFCPGSASSSGWNQVDPLTCSNQDSTRGSYQSTLQRHRSLEQLWIIDATLTEGGLCFWFYMKDGALLLMHPVSAVVSLMVGNCITRGVGGGNFQRCPTRNGNELCYRNNVIINVFLHVFITCLNPMIWMTEQQFLWMCSSLKHCLNVCVIMWIMDMVNRISRESLAPLVSVVSIDLYQKSPLTHSSAAPLTSDAVGSYYISLKELVFMQQTEQSHICLQIKEDFMCI